MQAFEIADVRKNIYLGRDYSSLNMKYLTQI